MRLSIGLRTITLLRIVVDTYHVRDADMLQLANKSVIEPALAVGYDEIGCHRHRGDHDAGVVELAGAEMVPDQSAVVPETF